MELKESLPQREREFPWPISGTRSSAAFLNLSTVDIWGQITVGCGGLPSALQGVQQNPSPLPNQALSCSNHKCLQTLTNILMWKKITQLENQSTTRGEFLSAMCWWDHWLDQDWFRNEAQVMVK